MKGFGYVEFDSPESVRKAFDMRGRDLDGRQINVDVASDRKNTNSGGNRGGYQGGQGGFQGGFRQGGNNNRSTNVSLSREDQSAKKGSMGEFKGKRIAL